MHPLVEQFAAPPWRALRRLKNRALNLLDPPLLVLAYHRVAELPADPHQLAVAPHNFRAQLDHLRRRYSCIRLGAEWSATPRPAVALTFDDGYADNLHQALPLLEEAGLPATFFICSGMLDSPGEFWSDELERLLLGPDAPPATLTLTGAGGGSWPCATPREREALHRLLHRRLLRLPPAAREEWLVRLRDWAGDTGRGRASHRALTGAELRALAASPLVAIGAHAVSHTPLALLDPTEQQREMIASKARLEELTGRTVELFSYPFGGRGDYSRATARRCRAAGFRCAVTTLPGQVHRWSDPWQLPRQLVRNWDAATFAARLTEFRCR